MPTQSTRIRIKEPIPETSDFTYSDTEMDWSSPLAGGCAWVEGEFVPVDEARVSILDAGFRYSDITYTAVAVWNGNLFRLNDHLDRLIDGATRMELELRVTKEEIAETCRETVARSQLREAFLMVALSSGWRPESAPANEPARPQMYMYAVPFRWVFSPEQQMTGTSLRLSRTVRRAATNSIDPTIKNFSWGDLTRARHEAVRGGATSALLLDQKGDLSEGPGFNVVLVKGDRAITPADNCLPGITRRTSLEIAESLGLLVEIRDVREHELYDADEVFVTTTAGGVTPVVELDGKLVGDGTPGTVTRAIRRRYWELMDEPSALIEAVDYRVR